MTIPERYDKMITGIVSGLVFPFIIGLVVFLFTSKGQPLHFYLFRIATTKIITQAITLCVFPNVIIFLIFNRFDMLRATRGVLAMTIVWAVAVFVVKFLT